MRAPTFKMLGSGLVSFPLIKKIIVTTGTLSVKNQITRVYLNTINRH